MTIDEAFFSLLSNDADVVAKVSNRIYPDKLPQNVEYPAIRIVLTSETHNPIAGGVDDLPKAGIDVDVFAASRESANVVSELVRISLDGYNGTIDGLIIQAIMMNNRQHFYDDDEDAYQTSNDFLAFFEQ
jgi:hypothetical protein